jgi:Lrp/AsnC family leucine-responsive transcriptional regulator
MANQCKLDQIDRRILQHLQSNSRISNHDLAQAVHLSESPCLRRHKLLERNRVIVGYTAVVKPSVLGFGVVAFIDVTLDRTMGDVATFRKITTAAPEVTGCTATAGDYDFLLKVVAKDIPSVSLFVNETLRHIPGVKTTNINLTIDPDPALFAFYNYFHPGRLDDHFKKPHASATSLDDIDTKIVRALIYNGRLRSVELAREIGHSHSSCLRRIRALEKSGVICGYMTVIEPSALGRELVTFVGLKLKQQSSLASTKSMLESRADVAAVHEVAGNIDLLLRVTSSDMDEYARFVRECIRQIEDVEAIHYSYAIDPVPTLFLSYKYTKLNA